MAESRDLVLLVGRRNGAVRAAKKLGLEYRVVVPDAANDGALRLDGPPTAVVATTEAAVMPAATLRRGLGLPGLSVEVAARCTDKLVMKKAMTAAGIRCARFQAVASGPPDRQELTASLGLPMVLKTQTGSGGRGTLFIRAADDFPQAVTRPSIAESFVEGVEMSVESFVIDGAPVFVNFTEYAEPAWANVVPAALAPDLAVRIRAMNEQVIAALGIDGGMTHLEIFLTRDGPVFGEVAARPPGGKIMDLIQLAYGFDPWQALLAIATRRPPGIENEVRQTAATRFFHPGTGFVRSVRGLDELKSLASTNSIVCKLTPGDRVGPRAGTGEHCGFAVLAGDAGQVRRDLDAVRKTLQIELESAT